MFADFRVHGLNMTFSNAFITGPHLFTGKEKGGLPPNFLWSLVALASLRRLSLLKTAHVAIAECRVAGNPGPPDFLWSLVAFASLRRLSLLKTAHVVVAECRVAGNPGRPSCSTHVRESPRTWGTRPGGKAGEQGKDLSHYQCRDPYLRLGRQADCSLGASL